MAYNKRTWLGRQGTGLNKFSIGGATPVTIVNQPDSVTQVGDALSAGNLNDLEDRIEDAFDDVDTALDTKADEQDVTNLNNAISQIDHRLDNLEQAKGDYEVSNYKDGSITPSGKGAWAIVEGLRGVSRVENQMVKTPTEGGVYAYSSAGAVSYSGDTIINTAGSNIAIDICNQRYQSPLTFQQNHTYLLSFDANVSESVALKIYLKYSLYKTSEALSANKWTKVSAVATWTSATEGSNFFDIITQSAVSQGATLSIKDIVFTDLNIYFGTTDLSFLGATDSAKLATIQTNYPHLLTPSEYGTRIVDSSYTGVRAWARNLWDEQWEVGVWNLTTGEKANSSTNIRCKNKIAVKPLTTYFFMASKIYYALFYNANDNFIGKLGANGWQNGNTTFETPANCAYVAFYMYDTYGTTYNHDICINISDSQNGTYTPYHAPSTLSLSFTGKSAGSVSEMYYPETGEQTKPLGEHTFTNDDAWETYYAPNGLYSIPFPLMKVGSVNAILLGYTFYDSYSAWGNASDKALYKGTDGKLYVKNVACTSLALIKAEMAGKPLTYELATPAPSTFVTPIIDNTLLTESGGRMSTVQTGTIVDGSFDLGFINL